MAGRCASVNGGGSHLKDGLLRELCLIHRPEPYWSVEALMTYSSLAFYALRQMEQHTRSLASSLWELFGSVNTFKDPAIATYSL